MSKKGRARRELNREFAHETVDGYKRRAMQFIQESSPFELSCELTRRGVSTAHREGIFQILDAHVQSVGIEKLSSGTEFDSSLVLASAWRREIESKGREPGIEDRAFLVVAALHFSLKWSESRLAISEARLKELESAKARKEQDPPKA
ncbi:MAG: hypothetical protein NDJ89_18075 [Oligoflexia bacterium]|nr:hypothetical protein [Oligoflexia bacterium]